MNIDPFYDLGGNLDIDFFIDMEKYHNSNLFKKSITFSFNIFVFFLNICFCFAKFM